MNDSGDSIHAQNAGWTFAGKVPEKFDEHVSKSVPMYHQGHDLVVKLSDYFLSNGSFCYDLGCSTGTLTKNIAQRNNHKKIQVIGIDSEADMINFAKNNHDLKVEFYEANILDYDFEKADLMVAYYTIQFTKPRIRQIIFDRIFESLNWGGAFILFEKVRAPDARFQDIMTSLYTDYKIDQGYTSDNIISKAQSLKGVLEPFSTNGNLELMSRAGFKDITSIMKYVCFEGFLAIK